MEIYSVDINAVKKCVLYGTSTDSAELYNYTENYPICRVQDFTDSVIFVKFINDERFILVTINGTIALMESNRELEVVKIEEDVTSVCFDTKLVIGTESGRVYIYDDQLEHINTCGGHNSEIIDVDFKEDRILSLDNHRFIACDEYGRKLYEQRARNATAFCYISGDVYCLALDGKIQILKGKEKLFELSLDGDVESIVLMGNNLVLGGSFEYILLIDTTRRYATYKLKIEHQILKIKKNAENQILFSTSSDQLGLVDIRDIKSLKLFEPEVGTIFDFAGSENDVIVAGENGFLIFNFSGESFSCDFSIIHEENLNEDNIMDDIENESNPCDIEDSNDENSYSSENPSDVESIDDDNTNNA